MGPARARGRAVSVWGGVAIAVAVVSQLLSDAAYTSLNPRVRFK